MKNYKKIIAITIVCLMVVAVIAGCFGGRDVVTVEDGTIAIPYPWMNVALTDSSEIEDFDGSVMEFTLWDAGGMGGAMRRRSTNDVVTPEIERITGVRLNHRDSIDNAGMAFPSRLTMLNMADDIPDIIIQGDPAALREAGVIWDLTELLPRYGPTIMQYPTDFANHPAINAGDPGRIWAIPFMAGNVPYVDIIGVDPMEVEFYADSPNPYDYVWVRDDILRQIFPNAKTQQEIEDIYMEYGRFTPEQIFDVTFDSADEFFSFLYAVRDLELVENGRRVYATYVRDNADPFNLMNQLWASLGGRGVGPGGSTWGMYTFWNQAEQRVDVSMTQDNFRQELRAWNQLVRDGVVAEASFIDTRVQFEEKLMNGQYAVLYGFTQPDNATLRAVGMPFQYRRVHLRIPMQQGYHKSAPARPGFNPITLNADLTEDQVIRIIRWVDFQISSLGQKLIAWGPYTAGLWEVDAAGLRRFINPEVEAYALHNINTDIGLRYNIRNGNGDFGFDDREALTLPFYWGWVTRYNAAATQPEDERERNPEGANNMFRSAWAVEDPNSYFTPLETVPAVWVFQNDLTMSAFNARAAIDEALLRILAASNDADFDRNWDELQEILVSTGWTREMTDLATAEFFELNPYTIQNIMR